VLRKRGKARRRRRRKETESEKITGLPSDSLRRLFNDVVGFHV